MLIVLKDKSDKKEQCEFQVSGVGPFSGHHLSGYACPATCLGCWEEWLKSNLAAKIIDFCSPPFQRRACKVVPSLKAHGHF